MFAWVGGFSEQLVRCWGEVERLEGALLLRCTEPEVHLLQREAPGAAIVLADSRFVAQTVGRRAQPGTVRVVRREEAVGLLAEESIELLPLGGEQLRRLERLGLKTMGQLARLPRGSLIWMLGGVGHSIEELVRGEDRMPLSPERPVDGAEGSVEIESGSVDRERLIGCIMPLLTTLWRQLAREGKAALKLRMVFEPAGQVEVNWRQPLGSVEAMAPLLRSHLERLQLQAPVERIHLQLTAVVVLRHREMLLWETQKKGRLQELHQQLVARGGGRLQRVVWENREARLPERRARLSDRRPLCVPRPVEVSAAGVAMRCGWVPVERVVDTWQVDWDWWSDRPVSRRYHRLRLANGALVSLFQDCNTHRWYRQYQ